MFTQNCASSLSNWGCLASDQLINPQLIRAFRAFVNLRISHSALPEPPPMRPRLRRSAGELRPSDYLLQPPRSLAAGWRLRPANECVGAGHDAAVQMIDTSVVRAHRPRARQQAERFSYNVASDIDKAKLVKTATSIRGWSRQFPQQVGIADRVRFHCLCRVEGLCSSSWRKLRIAVRQRSTLRARLKSPEARSLRKDMRRNWL